MNYSIVVLDAHTAVSKAISSIFECQSYHVATSNYSFEKLVAKLVINKNKNIQELEYVVNKIIGRKECYYSPAMLNIILNIMGNDTIKTGLIYKPNTREKEIINLFFQRCTSSQISEKLYLSKNTVDTFCKNILLKSGTLNVSHLMRIHIDKLKHFQ